VKRAGLLLLLLPGVGIAFVAAAVLPSALQP